MLGDIFNKNGEKLDYSFRLGSEKNRYLLIIGCGLPGYVDHPLVDEIAHNVSDEGLSVLSFSFSGNGNSQGRFLDSTITKRIDDLNSIISVSLQNGWRPIYAGHGLNSTVGVLTSVAENQIEYLISLGGVLNTKTFCKKMIEINFLDQEKNVSAYDKIIKEMNEVDSILPRAKGIKIPWLLIHAKNDNLVPLTDTESLMGNCEATRDIFQVEDSDHAFSGKAISEVSEILINWLGQRIQRS